MKSRKTFNSVRSHVVSLLVVVVWLAVAVFAQESRGTIIGRVRAPIWRRWAFRQT